MSTKTIAATMPKRKPFGEVSSTRLASLQNIKNQQNCKTSPSSNDCPLHLSRMLIPRQTKLTRTSSMPRRRCSSSLS